MSDPIVNLGLLDTPQRSTLTFAPTGLDKSGNSVPAKVANAAWAVDNAGIAAITPSTDNSSCLVVAGTDGVANVTLTANPLKQDGTPDTTITLTAQVQVTVTSGVVSATMLNVTASTPA